MGNSTQGSAKQDVSHTCGREEGKGHDKGFYQVLAHRQQLRAQAQVAVLVVARPGGVALVVLVVGGRWRRALAEGQRLW